MIFRASENGRAPLEQLSVPLEQAEYLKGIQHSILGIGYLTQVWSLELGNLGNDACRRNSQQFLKNLEHEINMLKT